MDEKLRKIRAAKGAQQLAFYTKQIKEREAEAKIKPEIKVEFLYGGKIPPCK